MPAKKKEIAPIIEIPEPAKPKNGMEEKLATALNYEDQTDPFSDVNENYDEKSDVHKLAREIISAEDIEGKTHLTKKQARAFTAINMLHKRYPELGFDEIKYYMWIVTSEGGKGRDGLLETLKGRLDIAPASSMGEAGEIRRI